MATLKRAANPSQTLTAQILAKKGIKSQIKNSKNSAKMPAENLAKGKEMPKFEFTTPDKNKSAFELRPKTLEVLKKISNKPIINKNDGRVAYINKKGRLEMVNDEAVRKSTISKGGS